MTTPANALQSQTLAQLIRTKYPTQYNDMDDVTLETNWLKKYPEYNDLPRTQASKPIQDTSTLSARPSLGSRLSSAYTQGGVPGVGQELGESTRNAIANVKLPFLQKTVGEGLTDLGQMANMAGTEASLLQAPQAGEAVVDALRGGLPGILTRLARTVRNPATGRVRTPWETAIDTILPDPNAPTATPARTIPKGTNYGQYLEAQKAAAKPQPDPVLQAVREGRAAKIPTRMPKAAPPPAPPEPSPFAGAASSAQPGGAELQLPSATTPQQPFPQVGKAGAPPSAPRIVTPNAPEAQFSGSEGRAATWTNEDVMRLAQQGNRDAIAQAVRRGLQLPANARYVMGDPDMPRAVLNPREVTRFTPEGQPIRNMQRANAPPTSRAKIQLPWEQGSMATQAPTVSAPQLRPEVQQMAIPSGASKVPEWQVGQRDFEITRLKNVLRNPQATEEERAIAASQLKNYGGVF